MDSLENLRVLAGSKDFFRGLQHLYHQFKSGWRLENKYRNPYKKRVALFCGIGNSFGILFHKKYTSCENAQFADRKLLLRNRSRA